MPPDREVLPDRTEARQEPLCAFGIAESAMRRERSRTEEHSVIYKDFAPRSRPFTRRAMAAGAWSGMAKTEQLTLISHST
jgi:hypothetical protein